MRRKRVYKKDHKPDAIPESAALGRFINYLMQGGKKSVAEKVIYGAMDIIQNEMKEDPLKVFDRALENVMPVLEVVSRRIGGANYQIPVEVRSARRFFLASRWIIGTARSKKGKPMAAKLAEELMAAAKNEGEAVMDWMEQERERGITITSAATTTFWIPTYRGGDKNYEHRINIIDTPGHIDFTVEVKRSLRVLDGAVVVFDGVAGVEPQSETNWHYADEYKVPRVCFINKLDRTGASFENSFKSILERLTPNAMRLQIPIGLESSFEGVVDLLGRQAYGFEGEHGEKIVEREIPESMKEEVEKFHKELVEKIVEFDDELMHLYLEGKEPPVEDLKRALRKASLEVKIIPVLCGSALKNKGVQFVLDATVDYLPSPLDLLPVKATSVKTGEEILIQPKDDELVAALAFKIATDPFVGNLTYFRAYTGTVKKGSYILNTTKDTQERIGRLVRMHANHREDVDEIYSGDLGAIVGLKSTGTGDSLCDPSRPLIR